MQQISDFFNEYFIKPIYNYEGYNIYNTLAYAIVAIISLYFIYKYFRKEKIDFDEHFFKSMVPFIFFGSIKRAITDATDANIARGFPYEQFYSYNIWNVTPGIYIVVASIFLFSYLLEKKLNIKNLSFFLGSFLAIFHFLLLFPFLKHFDRAVIIIFLASFCYALSSFIFKEEIKKIAVFSQSLDGAATFVSIEFFGYKEQHVLPNIIGETFGFQTFFLLKFFLTVIILYLLDKESFDDQQKNVLIFSIVVMGLSPGLRDMLRLVGDF